MKTDDKIRDKKLQHNITREVVKMVALSSEKVEKIEDLIGVKVLLSN